MADFIIKQGDRLPALVATLKDGAGASVNLSSGVQGITFSMRRQPHGLAVITNQPAAIVDATGGVVQYLWQAGDTVESGTYHGEFTVNYSSGQSLTFPNLGYIGIHIELQIA